MISVKFLRALPQKYQENTMLLQPQKGAIVRMLNAYSQFHIYP